MAHFIVEHKTSVAAARIGRMYFITKSALPSTRKRSATGGGGERGEL
jgi:hypothetical protein